MLKASVLIDVMGDAEDGFTKHGGWECDEPDTLLEFLQGRMSTRKSRLLAASFCRHILPWIEYRSCEKAIEIAEQYADGRASLEEMLAVSEQIGEAYVNVPNPAPMNTEAPLQFKAESIAIQSTRFLTWDIKSYLSDCCQTTYLATLRFATLRAEPGVALPPYTVMMQWQCELIKDIICNPFRPITLYQSWLTSTVKAVATAVYEEKAFDRLPILADAL